MLLYSFTFQFISPAGCINLFTFWTLLWFPIALRFVPFSVHTHTSTVCRFGAAIGTHSHSRSSLRRIFLLVLPTTIFYGSKFNSVVITSYISIWLSYLCIQQINFYRHNCEIHRNKQMKICGRCGKSATQTNECVCARACVPHGSIPLFFRQRFPLLPCSGIGATTYEISQ